MGGLKYDMVCGGSAHGWPQIREGIWVRSCSGLIYGYTY